jgi:hypothetical protein
MWLRGEPRGPREGDPTPRADNADAERDRGNVPFARGPQTQDETERTFGQSGLFRMWCDGRIKQSRRLWRIFVREIRADERLPLRRRLPRLVQVMAHLHEAVAEDFSNILVPVLKLAHHLTQQLGDCFIRKSHDAGDYSASDIIAGGIIGTHEHSRPVGNQSWSNPFGHTAEETGGFEQFMTR